MPFEPTSAAEVLTLKSPPPELAEDQSEELPDSKPLAKIRLGRGVFVAVKPSAKIRLGRGVFVAVDVGEDPGVLVAVAVMVDVRVGIKIGVADAVGVNV